MNIFGFTIAKTKDLVAVEDYKILRDMGEQRYLDLYTVSMGLRQATQELYDQYCPGMCYYPLDVALGEFDEVVK